MGVEAAKRQRILRQSASCSSRSDLNTGFSHLDVAARAALVKAVSDETQAVAQRYRDGDEMTFPICTHIALAYGK